MSPGCCSSPRDAGRLLSTLGPRSPLPGGAQQCLLPVLPAGIRTPLQHKRLLYARELFDAAGPGLQAEVPESTWRVLP